MNTGGTTLMVTTVTTQPELRSDCLDSEIGLTND
jgi:hypothetical protein